MILTRSRNFYFTFSMKLMRFPQVDLKLYEINANLTQVCKLSQGKNTRILVYNTKIVFFLTQQYFFQHNGINSVIHSVRINSRFWILSYFLTASVIPATQYPFNMTCLPLSLFKCSYTFENVLSWIGFSVDNFKSAFTVVTSHQGSACHASVM